MSRHTQTVLTILMIGVVIATSSLLVSLWLLPPQELTPVLSVLDENQETNYPTEIQQYSNISLHFEVQNFMGSVQYFYVYVKLATSTTMATSTAPSSAPLLRQYEQILLHGDSWLHLIHLNMTTLGSNYRLTFELWRYSIASGTVSYTGIWVHIPLNVTAS